jgi:hypothetical protein
MIYPATGEGGGRVAEHPIRVARGRRCIAATASPLAPLGLSIYAIVGAF